MRNTRIVEATLSGTRLLMHNGQLADPLNEYAKALKEVTSRKKKSDDDHLNIAKIEFMGGLYFSDDIGPYLPCEIIDAVLIEGARKKKRGRDFESSVRVVETQVKLEYAGPRTREGLWADKKWRDRRAVVIGMARTIRTRPLFPEWKVSFHIEIFPSAINVSDVREALEDAGMFVGICDYRPRFGVFEVTHCEETTRAGKTEKRNGKGLVTASA